MRFRAGFVVGAAIGYVLGARAGRERYEQIRRLADKTRQHPAVGQLTGQAGELSDAVRGAVAGGLSAGSERLHKVGDRLQSA